MVLPPSSAAEGQAPKAEWLRALRRWLQLGRKGVIVMVRDARPARLRALVETLEELEPGFRFTERAEELGESAPGELVLLGLRAEDLDWLNLNRPIFAQRKLRAVLWAEGEIGEQLKFLAPDLHDWISHFIACPPGVPRFAIAGLDMGLEWWPGVAWTGAGFDEVWAALRGGEPPPQASAGLDYDALVERLEAAADEPVLSWTEVDTARRLTLLRWAIAESGYEGRHVLLNPTVSTPGWFPVDSRCLSLAEAAAQLRAAGLEDPCRAAAWLELEPSAVSWFGERGILPPRRRVEQRVVVRREASAEELEDAATLQCGGMPLRALFRDPRVQDLHSEGISLSAESGRAEVAVSLSLMRLQGRRDLARGNANFRQRDFIVELLLREAVETASNKAWELAAAIAASSNHVVIARRWQPQTWANNTNSEVALSLSLGGDVKGLGGLELPLGATLRRWAKSLVLRARRDGWQEPVMMNLVLILLRDMAAHGRDPTEYLAEVVDDAKAQLGARDPDYLRLLHLIGAQAMLLWPERGAELLLEERAHAELDPGAPEASARRLQAWAYALLERGEFGQAAELLRPHARDSSKVARLLCRVLLRQGEREAAEQLAARLDLPSLAEIEAVDLEDERRAFFQAVVDEFAASVAQITPE